MPDSNPGPLPQKSGVSLFPPFSKRQRETLEILILLPGAAVCPIIDRVSFTRVVHHTQCFTIGRFISSNVSLGTFTLPYISFLTASHWFLLGKVCLNRWTAFLNASQGRSTLSTVRDGINTLLFSYQRFLTILCFTFHKDCPLHSMLQYGAWHTPLILFLGLICSTIVSFKVAVSQDFLAFFILIIQPIWDGPW